MKRNTRKIISLLLTATSVTSLLSACGGRDNSSETVDEIKAQLHIANYESGYGRKWLEDTADMFEEYYKDYDFGNGKIGVQVHMEHQLDQFKETILKNTMKDLPYDVYYLGGFLGNASFGPNGEFVDITKTVTEKVYDEDGNFAKDTGKPATQSIVDTMYDEPYIDMSYNYNYGTDQPAQYYRLPWTMAFSGFVYDADLFNENGYFVDAQGNFGATYEDIENGNCSKGPDGVLGTSDDGFVETWNDFVSLMDYMVNTSGGTVIPFTWSGTMTYQREYAFRAIWANYEGENDYALNFSFKGKDNELGTINQGNAYILQQQEGKKAAIKAFYDIMSDTKYYSSNAFKNDHLEAQQEYVWSKNTDKRIAFFMEGAWWEEEARDVFDSMSDNPEDAYAQRNFRMMPIPRFENVDGISNQKNTERVLSGEIGQFEAISKYSDCPEIGKMWIQFAHSRSALSIFTKDTGCFRPFNFTPTTEEYNSFTKFTQSQYEFISEGAKIVFSSPTAPAKYTNPTAFQYWDFQAIMNGVEYRTPIDAFRGVSGASVNEVFKAMQNTWKAENWGYQDY